MKPLPRRQTNRARVLVVDDSDATRGALCRILESAPDVVVVGAARDGEEGLREVLRLEPDMVFLDLHMPRMDGFTFLRLLMARRPTPVVVVSSQSRRSDAFKALELGALDFVAKADADAPCDTIVAALLEKCELLRALRRENLAPRRGIAAPVRVAALAEPSRVVAVAASTGGPQAIQALLSALPADPPVGYVVAQHLPERFTGAFAERLGAVTRFSVQEAEEGDLVAAGRVLVAPGGRHLEVKRGPDGALRAAIVRPEPGDGPSPSADRLFASVARALGRRACAVVLTGMGHDGRAGVSAVKREGGLTIAEAEETAVVGGMPQAAAQSGAIDEVVPLHMIAGRIVRFGTEG